MAPKPSSPRSRLPWWAVAAVLVLAALGAVWVVKLLIGIVWTIIEIGAIVAIVLLVVAITRARADGRQRRRARTEGDPSTTARRRSGR